MLLNEHCVLASNGYSLALGGVTDAAASRINAPGPDIGAALSGVPEGMTKILMSHRPDNAKESARAGVDLQLSGHTHGGQVVGFHFIVKFANDGYYSGLYSVDNMWLYVSNGTGVWTGFPVRLGKPPEITRLVLRAGGD
jgi:predicted MPP superfamily phosphohydrolase